MGRWRQRLRGRRRPRAECAGLSSMPVCHRKRRAHGIPRPAAQGAARDWAQRRDRRDPFWRHAARVWATRRQQGPLGLATTPDVRLRLAHQRSAHEWKPATRANRPTTLCRWSGSIVLRPSGVWLLEAHTRVVGALRCPRPELRATVMSLTNARTPLPGHGRSLSDEALVKAYDPRLNDANLRYVGPFDVIL